MDMPVRPHAPHGRASLLSDDLVRALIAAGQVDVLVGIPTLDNAKTIRSIVTVVMEAFAGPLARQRALLLDADGGSNDSTPDIVRSGRRDSEPLVATHTLRTIHRISAPYHGVPGRAGGLRLIFAAADLIGARAIVVLDPEVEALTSEAVGALATAVLDGRFDLVKPHGQGSPWQRPLVTQLVAPLMRSQFGRYLHEPTATQFACSKELAGRSLTSKLWDDDSVSSGADLWLTTRALSDGHRVAELASPVLPEPVHASRPRAKDAFEQVVGALFESLVSEALSPGAGEVSILGEPPPLGTLRPAFSVSHYEDAFVRGVADLAPILEPALGPDVFGELSMAQATRVIGDDLWARVVLHALDAARRRVLPRSQIVSALFPLYLGRVATFLNDTREVSAAEADARIERLSACFLRVRSELSALHQETAR